MLGGLVKSVGKIIGGAAKALSPFSPIIGGVTSAYGQARTNQQMIDLANTSYSRTMADMRKAGLNPILAYKQSPVPIPTLINPFGNAVNSAIQAQGVQNLGQLQGAQTALTEQQTKVQEVVESKVNAEVHNIWSQYNLNQEKAEQVKQLTSNAVQQGINLLAEQNLIEANTGKAVSETAYRQAVTAIPDLINNLLRGSGVSTAAEAYADQSVKEATATIMKKLMLQFLEFGYGE